MAALVVKRVSSGKSSYLFRQLVGQYKLLIHLPKSFFVTCKWKRVLTYRILPDYLYLQFCLWVQHHLSF